MLTEGLGEARERGWARLYPDEGMRITVGTGTCGLAAGARAVLERLTALVEERGLAARVVETGCMGACFAEPLVAVQVPGLPRMVYCEVDEAFCDKLVDALGEGILLEEQAFGYQRRDWAEGFGSWVDLAEGDTLFDEARDLEDHPFFRLQEKRISSSWGVIEPWSVEEYAALGGYGALQRALAELSPEQVVGEVEASGLRGRGGAGFPTGSKMRAVAQAKEPLRYLIVNADEGDPGAYMDRGLMESDPHRLIEGVLLAAYAVGASEGFVFTRSEYPGAIQALERALDEARDWGLLGKGALGDGRDFALKVVRSAGAYICGEESALIAALEGRRPDPHRKPPYPSESGLFGKPTLVSNVETYANLPSVIAHGAASFRILGTQESPGTKIFSLAGAIERAGLVEVPMGMPLIELVNEMAVPVSVDERNVVRPGAMREACVQVGGPSGAILPASLPGLTLDFEGLVQAGGIMGSGGIVVLGGQSCVVDTVRYFTGFSASASCGQCRLCAGGLSQAERILTAICSGLGSPKDLETLAELCELIPKGSKCALGSMAVKPLKSALRYFREEFESHLAGQCPSLVCKELMHFKVIEEGCPGCLCCLPSCPTGAIKGIFGKPFRIEQERCTKCWMCVAQCPYPALMALPGAAEGAPRPQAPAEPVAKGAAGCIACGKCVKACRERGASALCFMDSGVSRHVAKPLCQGQGPCTSCGACLEVCPTGAVREL